MSIGEIGHFQSEPGKIRPAIVIGDPTLFDPTLGVLTVVPLTGDQKLALPALSVRIKPTPENGLTKPTFALAWNVQTVAIQRVRVTAATITSAHLHAIKRRIAECLGL